MAFISRNKGVISGIVLSTIFLFWGLFNYNNKPETKAFITENNSYSRSMTTLNPFRYKPGLVDVCIIGRHEATLNSILTVIENTAYTIMKEGKNFQICADLIWYKSSKELFTSHTDCDKCTEKKPIHYGGMIDSRVLNFGNGDEPISWLYTLSLFLYEVGIRKRLHKIPGDCLISRTGDKNIEAFTYSPTQYNHVINYLSLKPRFVISDDTNFINAIKEKYDITYTENSQIPGGITFDVNMPVDNKTRIANLMIEDMKICSGFERLLAPLSSNMAKVTASIKMQDGDFNVITMDHTDRGKTYHVEIELK
jgi:hypothetical protein